MIKFTILEQDARLLNKEGNALKRYNSRLVFNSFVSEITDVPKHDANSQVRIKKIWRDFSNGSMKNLWYNMLHDQNSWSVLPGLNKDEMTPVINLSNNNDDNLDWEIKIALNSGDKWVFNYLNQFFKASLFYLNSCLEKYQVSTVLRLNLLQIPH